MEIFFKEAENNVHAAKTVEQSKFTVSWVVPKNYTSSF